MTDPDATTKVYEPWDSDHTALVHVLWRCRNDWLDLKDDCDEIGSRILQSDWFAAVRQHVTEGWR